MERVLAREEVKANPSHQSSQNHQKSQNRPNMKRAKELVEGLEPVEAQGLAEVAERTLLPQCEASQERAQSTEWAERREASSL